ncbi:hypothetical protein [Nannocystis radixulma]|uniref:Uncharacterized protein n=1 Tax=Nannocystis radixulma TaxID=2995305 RepID=A0ABT5BFY5_9BACT|nr:hypothetical protein [Nannocystis radixulma]MDC0671947.1 hypothetical protein [Nannocystis radixulma]
MPTTTHEPSGLIAIRALVDMERERQQREQAAVAAREAAERAAREAAEQATRAEAEARARAAAEAAEQARRVEEQRRHEERLRAAEIEGRLRASQAARVQAELDARTAAPPSGRVGLWTAGALGLVGLGLAVLLKSTTATAPAPALLPQAEDTSLRDAHQAVQDLRRELEQMEHITTSERVALEKLLADRQVPVAAAPEPPAPARPRPVARPTAKPSDKPVTGKPGGIKICDTNDPLAEDC